MLAVFEVFLAPGGESRPLLTEEIARETMAQVMTYDEAVKVGFSGLEPDPKGREVRFIAVRRRDAPWIHRALETNEAVASFRVHEVD